MTRVPRGVLVFLVFCVSSPPLPPRHLNPSCRIGEYLPTQLHKNFRLPVFYFPFAAPHFPDRPCESSDMPFGILLLTEHEVVCRMGFRL